MSDSRILLVSDVDEGTTVLRVQLELSGFRDRVVLAKTTSDAIRLFDAVVPDLIIVRQPGSVGGGPELETWLAGLQETPVLVIGDPLQIRSDSVLPADYSCEALLKSVGELVVRSAESSLPPIRLDPRGREFLDQLCDAVLLIDCDTCTILEANTAAEQLYHRERTALVGMSLLQLVSTADHVAQRDCLRSNLRGQSVRSYRTDIDSSGNKVRVSVSSSVIAVDGRSCLHQIIRDDEERLCLEEQLRNSALRVAEENVKLRAELELHKESSRPAQGEMIKTLGTGVAHEFNNRLAAILMAIEAIEMDDDAFISESATSLIDLIRSQASMAVQVVKRLSNLCIPGRPQRKLSDLNLVCGTAIDLVREQAESNQVELLPRIPKVPFVFSADKEALVSAVFELLTNAVIASDPGSVVELVLSRTERDVQITVRDYGRGIPKEDLEHVYHPFFTTRRYAGGGVGLGLSLARKYIEDHGGRIELLSNVEHGTTAVIWLPPGSGSEPS